MTGVEMGTFQYIHKMGQDVFTSSLFVLFHPDMPASSSIVQYRRKVLKTGARSNFQAHSITLLNVHNNIKYMHIAYTIMQQQL